MTPLNEDELTPRWLRLAAAVSAEPGAAALARARARLAARATEPSWLRWLARPVALATAAGLLALSVLVGSALVGSSPRALDEETLAYAELLGEDGNFGLAFDDAGSDGATTDSGGVAP